MPKYLKGMVIWSTTMVVTSIGKFFTKIGECPWAWYGLFIVWGLALCAFIYNMVKYIKSTRKDS